MAPPSRASWTLSELSRRVGCVKVLRMKLVAIQRTAFWLMFYSSLAAGYAETIILQPVADTTLIEYSPDNNHGGTDFFNAGTTGGIANGARNRGLIRFDFSSIPAHLKIKSVSMTLEVTRAPAGAGGAPFALHRMLKNWGEGNKDSTDEISRGLGIPATTNEATWNSPFAFSTNNWSVAGAGGDFDTLPSSQSVAYPDLFSVFASTPRMVADVETWISNPASNFGWLLKTDDENVFSTARSFGSREFAGIDTNSPPFIEIKFVTAPVISQIQAQNGQFTFSFLAEAEQAYVVESKTALGTTNAWETLTNISAPPSATNIVVSDSISAIAKFYRVTAP